MVPAAGVQKMECGIKIECKKRFGQFLITNKPYCVIDDAETKELEWNEEIFIPLQPNRPYKITVQFPYMSSKACGPATITAQLNPNEIQVYKYTTPSTMLSAGKIERKS